MSGAIARIFSGLLIISVLMLAFGPLIEFIADFTESHESVAGNQLGGAVDGLMTVTLQYSVLIIILALIAGAVMWAIRRELLTTGRVR